MAQTQGSRAVLSGRGGGDLAVANRTGTNVSQREDLSNFISMITRDETPFMSSIGKTKATAIFHEWQTDELQAPGDSKIAEGVTYAAPGETISPASNAGSDFNVAGPNRTRLGNYCQINGKTIAVSGTRRAIDQAGVADEYAYQLKKRGTEMRRDIEHDLVSTNQISSPANATSARTMGTLRAWLSPGAATVVRNNVTAVSSNPSTGTSSAADHDSATKVALSLSDVDTVMQNIYEQGGKATRIMVSPKLRRDFSDLMVSDAGVRRNIDEKGKLRQSVDVYMSDFGDLMVIPNYVMGLGSGSLSDTALRDEAAFIYDPQWFSMATLRPMQEVEVGQRGDSTIGMFVEEQTFQVTNPLGSGAIYGLN